MGYYLDVLACYGVAWEDAPSACYPEDGNGEPIETGEPVGPDGALVWGTFGSMLSNPGRYLAVREATSDSVALYARRIEDANDAYLDRWRALIIGYLHELGTEPPHEPGWLALAIWG